MAEKIASMNQIFGTDFIQNIFRNMLQIRYCVAETRGAQAGIAGLIRDPTFGVHHQCETVHNFRVVAWRQKRVVGPCQIAAWQYIVA